MAGIAILLVGVLLLVPAAFFLQQPRGQWSILWDSLGITFGILGIATVLLALIMAAWRLLKGR